MGLNIITERVMNCLQKRTGKKYPDQVIHFDNFTVVSDKKTLDKYLN